MRRDPTNMIANRFKPLIACTNSPAIVNLPPAPSPTSSISMRNGHGMKRDPSDVDHLTKLLLKSMNSANEPNFFGKRIKDNIQR